MAKLSNASPRARRSTRSASAQPPSGGLKGTRGRPRKSIETEHIAPQPAHAASRAGRQTTKTTKASSAPRAHNKSNKSNQTQTATSTSRNSTRSSRTEGVDDDEAVPDRPDREDFQDLEAIPEDEDEDGDAGMSALSGATAVAFKSDLEISELRKKCDTFAEELPDITRISANFIDAMGKQPSLADLTMRLKTEQAFIRKAQKLVAQADLYKSVEELFIHPSAVVQALFNTAAVDEINSQPWSPAPIFRYANLGLLAQQIVAIDPASPEALSFLQVLDHSLCSMFWGPTIESDRSLAAFNIALEVRTQLAIACIRHAESSVIAADVVRVVFNDPTPGSTLRGWAQEEYNDKENYWTQEGKQTGITPNLAKRVRTLHKIGLLEIETEDIIEILLQEFPWSGFCDALLLWIASSASTDLEDHISAVGGIDRLAELLQEKANEYQNLPASRTSKKSSRSTEALRRISASAKAQRAQRARKEEQVSSIAAPAAVSEPRPTKPRGAFYKAQPNARKVPSISQSEGEGDDIETRPQSIHNSSNSEPSAFVTQDDGFQQQTPAKEGAINKKRDDARARQTAKRKAPLIAESPSRLKRPRRSTVIEDDLENNDAAASRLPDDDYQPAIEDEDLPAIARRGSEYESAAPRVTPAVLENVKEQARLASQEYNVNKTKIARSRIPWSVEEENCLVDLIELHGTSWGVLKKMDTDSRLHRRTPEDIRLKARLLKMDFLKTRQPLPENFDDVKLNAAQIQRLHEMGIEYLQLKVRGV